MSAILDEKKMKVRFATDFSRVTICEIAYDGKSYIGTARCNPKDAFDVEQGRDIAMVRAMLALTGMTLQTIQAWDPTVTPRTLVPTSPEEIGSHVVAVG